MKGYKIIQENMKSKNGDHTWKVGRWYKEDYTELCKKGFHACKKPSEAFEYIYGDKLFLVEARGKIEEKKDDKFVATEMRLIKELPLKEISVKYACYCARQCLKIYEKKYPNDKRPSEAIQAAEDYMDKKINLVELQEKISAACSVAWSAAESLESAAWSLESAAWSAAESLESAAWSLESAAWSAARSAARSAESAAKSAARSAARSAESAAKSAARSAARSAESAAKSAQKKYLNNLVKEYI